TAAAVPAPWSGYASAYTAGYVWPWLSRPRWGSDWGVDRNYLTFWANELQNVNTPWYSFSSTLIFKLVQEVEAKFGKLRGHLPVEFYAGPVANIIELKCDACNRYLTYVLAGGVFDHTNQPCSGALAPTGAACAGTLRLQNTYPLATGLPLSALGMKVGATWLFQSAPDTWAHEM